MNITQLIVPFPFAHDRLEGLHLTHVIAAIERETGQAKYADGEITAETLVRFEKGFVWERALSRAFAENLPYRPPSMVYDGITCSPDGIAYDESAVVPRGGAIMEYKCTSMRPDKTPVHIPRWLMQVKGYCYVFGIPRAVFLVLHTSIGMEDFCVYSLDFTDDELERNWASIVNFARSRGMLEGDSQ